LKKKKKKKTGVATIQDFTKTMQVMKDEGMLQNDRQTDFSKAVYEMISMTMIVIKVSSWTDDVSHSLFYDNAYTKDIM